jgi:hypothetical protein
MMKSRGMGAMRPIKESTPIDRYCMSPQIAPPYFNAEQKAKFATEDDYHEGRKK